MQIQSFATDEYSFDDFSWTFRRGMMIYHKIDAYDALHVDILTELLRHLTLTVDAANVRNTKTAGRPTRHGISIIS
jgi:hypothetical protein